VELHRRSIGEDIEELGRCQSDEPLIRARKKESVLRKLKRLMPAEAAGIGAVQDSAGRVLTAPDDIAQVLKQHWKGVFSEKEVSDLALQIWLDELFISDPYNGCFITGLPDQGDRKWVITRKEISKAIHSARDSMPGPDGIPSIAYKILGDHAVSILYDATKALGTDAQAALLLEAYHDRSTGGQPLF
jgi:hypothetical protein